MKYKKKKGTGERIVKAKPSGYEEKRVRRLGKIRILIGFLLIAVIAVGAWLAWEQIMIPYEPEEKTESSQTSSQQEEVLPIYGDDFNLKLATPDHPLEEKPQITEFQGVQMDERIIPALEALLQAAEQNKTPLKLVSGYVSPEEQDEKFNAEVERLMKEKKYSRVMAEQTAAASVSRGGQDESQTGLSVWVGLEDGSDFASSAQYRWLARHSVDYGFVFRYPEGKKSNTGREFDPCCIRYVGQRAALQMRQLQMCLEEYVAYTDR